MDRETWKGVALLVGAQIGAGVLGLPYAIKELGFFWGGTTVVLAGLLMMLTAFFLVESLYFTNPRYHLFDLVENYFGRLGAVVFALFLLLSVYGALSAYLNGMSQALNHLFGWNPLTTGVILWLILSAVVFMGLRTTAGVEGAAVVLLLILFASTIMWALPHIRPYFHTLMEAKVSVFIEAFSVAVFAFFAHLTIPEVVRLLRSRKKVLEAVHGAFVITIIVYVLFSLAVIGVLGEKTPQISVFGLVDVFGPYFAVVAYLIPLVTMLTSFVAIGLSMGDMLYEFLKRRWLSFLIVLVPPLLVFTLGADFFHSILFGSLGLILAGGVVPSLLVIRMKREGNIPHRVLVAVVALLLFMVVFLWDVFTSLAGT